MSPPRLVRLLLFAALILDAMIGTVECSRPSTPEPVPHPIVNLDPKSLDAHIGGEHALLVLFHHGVHDGFVAVAQETQGTTVVFGAIDLRVYEPLTKAFGVEKDKARAVFWKPYDRKWHPLKSLSREDLAKFVGKVVQEIEREREEQRNIPRETMQEDLDALIDAVDGDDPVVAEKMLKLHPQFLVWSDTDRTGRSLLHMAMAHRGGRVAPMLLQRGANVSTVDFEGNTALHAGCRAGIIENVNTILKHDPDLNARNDRGRTPIYEAFYGWMDMQHKGHGTMDATDHMKVIKRLLDARADWRTAPSHNDLNLFHAAVRSRNPLLVKTLLELGADPTSKTVLGLNAIHLALDSGEFQVLISKFILTRGPSRKLSPRLHNSLAHWGLDLKASILEGFHRTYNRTRFDETVNEWSCRLMRIVLDAVADPAEKKKLVNEADSYGMYPLHFAAFHGDTFSIRALLDAGADIHKRNKFNHTALVTAATRNYIFAANLLLERGANRSDLRSIKFYGWSKPRNDDDASDSAKAALDAATDPSGILITERGTGVGGSNATDDSNPSYSETGPLRLHRLYPGAKKDHHKRQVGYLDGWNHTKALDVDMSYCDIDRRSNLSLSEFINEYLIPGKPVVISDAATHWPALRKWSKKYMRTELPDSTYMIMSSQNGRPVTLRMNLEKYLSWLDQHSGEPVPTYLFDGYFEDHNSQVMRDVGRDAQSSRVNLRLKQPYFDMYDYYTYQLVVGPAYAGANPHFHHTTWNVLITGRKRWWIWPPATSFYSTKHPHHWFMEDYLPAEENAADDDDDNSNTGGHSSSSKKKGDNIDYYADPLLNGFQCMQEQGDLFFLPDMWGHAVVNAADSIAMAESTFFGYESLSGLPFDL